MKTRPPSFIHVIWNTAGRLARKLPIVLISAVACYGLYYLDQVKTRFDESRNRPIIVSDDLIARVESRVLSKNGEKLLPELRPYLHRIYQRRFASGSDLIATLDDELVAERNEKIKKAIYPEELNYRACVNDTQTRWKQNNAQATVPPDAFSQCYDQYWTNVNAKVEAVMTQSQAKISKFYSVISGNDLKAISDEQARAATAFRRSAIEESLQPTLDERRGLYIIYQFLRIACGIVIVFSLVAAIGAMLAAFWTVDTVGTLVDKAKGLVVVGGGSASSVGKLAAMSVAALGVGTAIATGVAVTQASSGSTAFTDQAGYEQDSKGVTQPIQKPGEGGGSGTGANGGGGTGGGVDLRR